MEWRGEINAVQDEKKLRGSSIQYIQGKNVQLIESWQDTAKWEKSNYTGE